MIGATADIQLGGVYMSPFIGYAVAALVLYLVLRPLLHRLRFERIFANPPLAEAALYVCILGLLVVFV